MTSVDSPSLPVATAASIRLAVVIPAFKAKHLRETLESLADQTQHHFRLYIADDASPEELEAIVAPYRTRLDLTYHRFPENLGGTSLVRHWHRAISLSSEPWVWLFSDDDVANPYCVAGLLDAIENRPHQCGLVRLPLSFIDDAGAVLERFDDPFWESAAQFYEAIVSRAPRFITIQNYAFSRAVYGISGNFPDFPKGWAVDLAAWVRFSVPGGVQTALAGRIFYRRHAGSISGNVSLDAGAKVESRLQFLTSTAAFIKDARNSLVSVETSEDLRKRELDWFCRSIRWLPRPLDRGERSVVRKIIVELWPDYPIRRELVFWNCWARPALRRILGYRRLVSMAPGASRGRNHEGERKE